MNQVTIKPDPAPARPPTLLEAVGALLAAIDARPARLNIGLGLELAIVREAIDGELESLDALRKVFASSNFYALSPEAIQAVNALLRRSRT